MQGICRDLFLGGPDSRGGGRTPAPPVVPGWWGQQYQTVKKKSRAVLCGKGSIELKAKAVGVHLSFQVEENAAPSITVKRLQNDFCRWNGQIRFVATSFDGVVSHKVNVAEGCGQFPPFNGPQSWCIID